MGTKALNRPFDIENKGQGFLGAGDQYVMYLKHFYEKNLPGTDSDKFEILNELISNNDDLQQLMADNDINQPLNPSQVNSPGGFIESLTNDQAKKFYTIVKASLH